MASGRINESQVSSDEEQEVFTGFTIEEIGNMRQAPQTRQEHTCFTMWMARLKTFSTYGPKKGVAIPMLSYTLARKKKKSMKKVATKNLRPKKTDQTLFNGPTHCGKLMLHNFPFVMAQPEISETMQLPKISSICLLTMPLLTKSSVLLLRARISAYPRLNILIGNHELPLLLTFWDSDEFFGVEGFKKTIPKHRFMTLGKHLHLANPTTEDRNDLLCKVCPLVTCLEPKFAEAYTPGKNITVNEGLVKFNGRLSFKQYMPMKPDKFGIKVWLLADADTYYVPRFQVYLAKNQTNSELFQRKGLSYYVVWTLGEPYLSNNRHFSLTISSHLLI